MAFKKAEQKSLFLSIERSVSVKRVIAMFVALIVCVSCFAIVASAKTHYSYKISTSTAVDGARKDFDARPANFIRYSNVSVSCLVTSASARVSLWKKQPPDPFFGEWIPETQVLNRGSDRYAWWQYTDDMYYLIHLQALNNQSNDGRRQIVTTNGTFQNYVGPY